LHLCIKAYNDERRYQKQLIYTQGTLSWYAWSDKKPSYEDIFGGERIPDQEAIEKAEDMGDPTGAF
jgi:hypothetical protein